MNRNTDAGLGTVITSSIIILNSMQAKCMRIIIYDFRVRDNHRPHIIHSNFQAKR